MRALLVALLLIAVPACHPVGTTDCFCEHAASLAFTVVDSTTSQPISGAEFLEGGNVVRVLTTSYACGGDGGPSVCSDYSFVLCSEYDSTLGDDGCITNGAHTFTVAAPNHSQATVTFTVYEADTDSGGCGCLRSSATSSAQVDAADAAYPITAIVKLAAAH